MKLPAEHTLREALNDEIHARPPEAMTPPLSISYLVMLSPPSAAERERSHVAELVSEQAGELDLPLPKESANLYSVGLPSCHIKVEWHTEFTRYTIMAQGAREAEVPGSALAKLPDGWVSRLPGELVFAAHCCVFPAHAGIDELAMAQERFGNIYVGAGVSGGAATAYTDFELRSDRFNLFLIFARETNAQQLGRIVQRLLEMNTYWILALLALPVARKLGPVLAAQEDQLQKITRSLAVGKASRDDPMLLRALTDLEAEVGNQAAEHAYRFSASRAYYALVTQRVHDLREVRIPYLQTFAEFTERRLAPAMATCQNAESRQVALVEGASRATRLLATRVSVNQELQNQALLESMDSRARLQLRLQQTVEGLSVAAITYYVAGLVSYVATGFDDAGFPVDAKLVTALSIPLVLVMVAMGVRHVRHSVSRGDKDR
jgi:uncharacterized membrane-anchored protein